MIRSSPGPRSLTEGPVGPALLAFAVPTLAGRVLQSINATTNATWIGRLLGQEALTASANANAVVFFLIGATFGLGLAATVLVAQSLGAKGVLTAKKTIGPSLTSFGGASVVLAG